MQRILAFLAGAQLAAVAIRAQPTAFSAESAVVIELVASGEAGAEAGVENVAAEEVSGDDGPGPLPELSRQDLIPVGAFVRTCNCTYDKTVKVSDIRSISDEFCSDGNAKSKARLSNMVWGFGQFLDHDLALSIEKEDGATIKVKSNSDDMELHRVVTTNRRGCKNSLNVHSHRIDAGPIYGTEEAYRENTLREPGTCFLRTADGNFLSVTTSADADGRFFFIAGDVRVSEHAFLAAQHTVWVREHNRICEKVNRKKRYKNMSPDDKFTLVHNVVIAKFQQVVLTEFLPALGITKQDVEKAQPMVTLKGVSVEFSIAYRLGHDLIGNTVDGITIADAFNAEDFFLDKSGPVDSPMVTYKADAEDRLCNIMEGLATTRANEIDGKLSDALRNFLFGRSEGEDLAGRNIFRGRDLGVPTYGGLAECYGLKPNAKIERETPDAWVGLMREPKQGDSPLPPTLRAIITEQFHRSFFGPGGFHWSQFPRKVAGFRREIELSSYAKIIKANTNVKVSGNVFKV